MFNRVNVRFVVERDGDGYGHAWWALLKPQDLVIKRLGSRRHVQIRYGAQLEMIQKPQRDPLVFLEGILGIIRKGGTIPDAEAIDAETVVSLPRGAIICASATSFGDLHYARVHSPPLIVERGGVWEDEARDGPRWVRIRIENARPVTVEEAERLLRRES